MTPSGWHDDARSRDAGHDEMQAAAYRYERANGRTEITIGADEKATKYRREGVYFEMPLYGPKGGISTFIDVFSRFLAEPTPDPSRPNGVSLVKHPELWVCYEIKPRIYSVGATIRQCRATDYAASSSRLWPNANAGTSWDTHRTPKVRVVPVVPHDDPKLGLLKEFWPTVWAFHAAAPT